MKAKCPNNTDHKALEKLDGKDTCLHFGPAHIVWEDENWHSTEWCIEHFNDYNDGFTEKENEVVMWSLVELAKIPMNQRDPEPAEYKALSEMDNEHELDPADYPPPEGVEMAREEIPDRIL